MKVVSNTSPITNLAAIQQLDLLHLIYDTIMIPQSVYNELTMLENPVPGTIEVQTLAWIKTYKVANKILVAQLESEIDPGESEAIALALEMKADRLIIDDYKGRKVAERFPIKFTGILGVLVIAKQRGFISEVRPVLNDLIDQAGFRVSDRLYGQILQVAGE
jgi:predicted nucleic acid-binding protein